MSMPTVRPGEKPTNFPPYAISAGESVRIQILRLILALMMPLHHVYSTANRFGDDIAGLVMPGWLATGEYIFVKLVTRCVPPTFAFISAILLFRKPFDWRKNIARKCRTLLTPLILLSSIWIALYAVGPFVPGLGKMFASTSTRVIDWKPIDWFSAYFGWTSKHVIPSPLYPLWFLRDLMLMNLLAPAIRWSVDRFPKLCLCAVAALLLWRTDNRIFFFTYHQVLAFFWLGCLAVRYNLHIADLDRIPAWLVAASFALAVAAAYMLDINPDVSSPMRGILNLLGTVFFLRFWSGKNAGRRLQRILLWLADYSIAIYFFHERMLTFLKRLALRLLPAGLPTTLFLFYALPLAVAAICVLIGWALRRRLPRVYSLLTGCR